MAVQSGCWLSTPGLVSSNGNRLAWGQLGPSPSWLEGSDLHVFPLPYTNWPACAHLLVLSSWARLSDRTDITRLPSPGMRVSWPTRMGSQGSQSCGQLFISHLMTTLPLCNYVLRICEIIWRGLGEREPSLLFVWFIKQEVILSMSFIILPCPKHSLSPYIRYIW